MGRLRKFRIEFTALDPLEQGGDSARNISDRCWMFACGQWPMPKDDDGMSRFKHPRNE